MMIFEIIFWTAAICIFHSYVLYPCILSILSSNKIIKFALYKDDDDLPKVSILISAFNEEEVIGKKIISIFENDYPQNKIQVLIGSDCSTDKTNEIVRTLTEKYKNLHFFEYTVRQGKGNVINNLFDSSNGNILILTDANVIFDKNTIFEMIKYYKTPKIGLVDTNMMNVGMKKDGISFQEKAYISREVLIKNQESILWGTMMGPFGGCFSLRKELFEKVPKNFLVDDFYINMKVYEKKFAGINSIDSIVYEDVSNNLKDEFMRKIRIATGNFQNLVAFRKLLLPLNSGLSFSFLSHKVLRWIGPFLIIASLLSLIILSFNSKFYLIALALQLFSLIIPLLDYILSKSSFNISFFRFVTHFYTMNLALLIGFFKFLNGVESNVWKPTKRNQ